MTKRRKRCDLLGARPGMLMGRPIHLQGLESMPTPKKLRRVGISIHVSSMPTRVASPPRATPSSEAPSFASSSVFLLPNQRRGAGVRGAPQDQDVYQLIVTASRNDGLVQDLGGPAPVPRGRRGGGQDRGLCRERRSRCRRRRGGGGAGALGAAVASEAAGSSAHEGCDEEPSVRQQSGRQLEETIDASRAAARAAASPARAAGVDDDVEVGADELGPEAAHACAAVPLPPPRQLIRPRARYL
mmetsp:Transcript_77476/g.250710  ORF Transcript_77476/g.250710 Transcript_77476/m.250710 type:complete len:243 (+) Transcript_77476:22-750(+)